MTPSTYNTLEKSNSVRGEDSDEMGIDTPGMVVLFGSGETSRAGQRTYDWVLGRMKPPVSIAVLETPAGFQPNSARVAEKVADFFRAHLQNHRPQVTVVSARQRGTPFSPDDPALLAPLLEAKAAFLGPGSPTYAVQQLQGSLAWEYLVARHRLGSAVLLASAATIAAGTLALPVYEIYKVGAELHWHPGLDFFGPYGLPLVLVPHWDNREGGAELDTSRAYMGQERFGRLLQLVPSEVTVAGIDEHTALVVDIGSETCRVMGRGGVTLLRTGEEARFPSGRSFPISCLGPFRRPPQGYGVRPEVWDAVLTAQRRASEGETRPRRCSLKWKPERQPGRAGTGERPTTCARVSLASAGG